jgi:DNA-binding NarL/FixJ family response regulator
MPSLTGKIVLIIGRGSGIARAIARSTAASTSSRREGQTCGPSTGCAWKPADRDPACLAQAATQHPDPWARASAAEDLGVLHGRRGDRGQAIHHLEEAFGGYRQVGADRDQARIRRRLRKLGIRRRHWHTPHTRPVTGWDSLTETEQAVARLVAEGLNNNQVAVRMYISTHTVAHHLRRAFRKLSIASRVELTRIVIEQTADGP